MPLPRDSIHSSASAEPTLIATPSGSTPEARRVDPNAPTMTPQAITHGGAHPPRTEDQPAPVRAPDIVAGLAPVESCADPQELARQATASPDPGHARMITDLRAELARAEALRRATLLEESLAALDAIAGRIPADHAPLQAELALIRGRVHATAGRHAEADEALRSAYFTGLRADHEPLAITAATELIHLSSEGLSDFQAAERWVRHARALLARGHAPALRADLAAAEGRLALHMGRYTEAGSQFVRALDLYAEAGLSDTPEAAVVLRTLADASLSAGKLDDAAEQLRRALIVLRRDYSPGHAEFAAAMQTEGRLALAHDDVPGALKRFERARHDLDGLVAVDNPVYLQLTCSAALAYIRNSELERATTLIREALGAVGSSHKAGKTVRLSPELFTLRHTFASLLAKQGQLPEAEATARDLLAEAERAWGSDEPHLATALATVAEILLASGRAAEALPLAERAHKLATAGGDWVHAKLRYNSAFLLARVLATTDARSRADTLARDAHALALSVGDKLKVAEIDKWLAEQSAR